MRLPAASDPERPLTFVGAPADSVGEMGGAEHGPAALRELGLVDVLGGGDAGDLEIGIRGSERDPRSGVVAIGDVLASTATLREAVAGMIGAGERPFVAGGCCSLVPGALAGARDALGTVGLAYVDGHLDLYDGTTSPTGEAADMPLAVVLGRGPGAWVEAAGGPSARPELVAVLGHRDQEESREYGMLQPEEIPGLTQLSIAAVRAEGPAAAGERAAAVVEAGAPFWLHLDVDVLDKEIFPATDYLMAGGMTWAELRPPLERLLGSGALAGASLGCYNPDKDRPGRVCGRALVGTLGALLAR